MDPISLAEGIKLTNEGNVALVRLDESNLDKASKKLDIILKSIGANSNKFDAIYIDYKLLVRVFSPNMVVYMSAYDMRREIKKGKNVLFINCHSFSETLLKLAEGTANYLIAFECSESEKEAMRAVEELEEAVI